MSRAQYLEDAYMNGLTDFQTGDVEMTNSLLYTRDADAMAAYIDGFGFAVLIERAWLELTAGR